MNRPTPTHVLETVIYADDLDAAESFYGDVLGLTLKLREPGQHVFFRCGESMVLIFNPASSAELHPEGIPRHGGHGAGHICWAATPEEIEVWRSHLIAHGVAIEHEQTWPNGARSIYFRDPAGNSLEFATPSLWA